VSKKKQKVPLDRDHFWWIHPALRGQQSLDGTMSGALPWKWIKSSSHSDADPVNTIDPSGPYADFAKLLYKLNGYKPGPVTGWYIVLSPKKDKFAVGQLCVDPNIPVILFEDCVFSTEEEARKVATTLKSANPGLIHTS
jgi:hypothetical protein